MKLDDREINASLFAFDSDADGILTSSEVSDAQLSFGVLLTDMERDQFEKKIDGKDIPYSHASKLIKDAIKDHDPIKELEKLVLPFDVEKNGTISLLELTAVFNTLSTRVSGEKALSLASQFCEGTKFNKYSKNHIPLTVRVFFDAV